MRVTRIASAHEYVHHVVNMNLSFFERQLPIHREGPGQIRVTAVVVFRPLQQQVAEVGLPKGERLLSIVGGNASSCPEQSFAARLRVG